MGYLQENGYYIITNKNSNKVLDVDLFDFEVGGLIKQCTLNGGNNQIFYFERQSDGSFSIKASHSGLYLEVEKSSMEIRAQIIQNAWKGTDNQKFYVEERMSGFYSIKAKHSGLCIDIEGAAINDGARVSQYYDNGTDAQLFSLRKTSRNKILIPDNYFKISNKNSGKVLDVYGFNFGESEIKEVPWNGGNNQIFFFERLSDNSYIIKAAHSGMVFDINATFNVSGDGLKQNIQNGGDNQKFYLEEDSSGVFYIKCKKSNKVLEVERKSKEEVAAIIQNEKNGGDNQKFYLKIIGPSENNHPDHKFIENGYYRIKNETSGYYFDVEGFRMDNGAMIKQLSWNNVNNQIFYFEYLGAGLHKIKAAHSEKVLNVKDASHENSVIINQWSYAGGQNQKFYAEPYRDKYRLRALHSNKVADVRGNSTQVGATIQQYDANYTNAQVFEIIKTIKNVNNTPNGMPYIQVTTSKAEKAIEAAKSMLGKVKYVYGGGRTQSDINNKIFDCSSFVHWCYSVAGVTLGPLYLVSTYTLVKLGIPVSFSNLQLGDLVFFYGPPPSHVGIYIGNNKFIHNENYNTGVVITSISDYYSKIFSSARRVV